MVTDEMLDQVIASKDQELDHAYGLLAEATHELDEMKGEMKVLKVKEYENNVQDMIRKSFGL
jgi:hypothetical protein